MTNSEYFEKNEISFSEAMEIFNKQKSTGTEFFDKFLASEHYEYKFKEGDIIVIQLNEETREINWCHNVVFKVLTAKDFGGINCYLLEYLTPYSEDIDNIGETIRHYADFIDRNCVLY